MKLHARSSQTKAAIDAMRQSFDMQGDSEVGIFWYDTENQELCGVKSTLASQLPWTHSSNWDEDVRTDSRLHRTVWNRELRRKLYGDYNTLPRGRVFEFKESGFVVYTGNWINDYPEAKEQILEVFNLPSNTKFEQDIHWDIGHGWSDEFI